MDDNSFGHLIGKEKLSILYAEDSVVDFVVYKNILEKSLRETYKVEIVNTQSLDDTQNVLSRKDFDIVIIDLNLLDSRGLDTFSNIKSHCSSQTPIIVLTGTDDIKTKNECIKAGVSEFFVKGVSDRNLISSILAFTFEQEKMKRGVRHIKA